MGLFQRPKVTPVGLILGPLEVPARVWAQIAAQSHASWCSRRGGCEDRPGFGPGIPPEPGPEAT